MSLAEQGAAARHAQANRASHHRGKNKSSKNAVTHGLSSAIAVLPFENQDEFNILVGTYIREQKPRNENEIHLAREMATSRWKLDRLRKIENAVLERMLLGETTTSCPYAILAKKLNWEGDPLSKLQRFQSALEGAYFRCNKELQILRKQPLPPVEPEIQNEMPLAGADAQPAAPGLIPALEKATDQPARSAQAPEKIQNEIIPQPSARLTAAEAIKLYRADLAVLRKQFELDNL